MPEEELRHLTLEEVEDLRKDFETGAMFTTVRDPRSTTPQEPKPLMAVYIREIDFAELERLVYAHQTPTRQVNFGPRIPRE